MSAYKPLLWDILYNYRKGGELVSDLLHHMGSRIMNRRKELNMKQEEVAEQAGLSLQTISSAERGKKALRPENILKISEVLHVSTDYLLSGKQPPSEPYGGLSNKISKLSPQQRRYLEQIIDNYLDAIFVSE